MAQTKRGGLRNRDSELRVLVFGAHTSRHWAARVITMNVIADLHEFFCVEAFWAPGVQCAPTFFPLHIHNLGQTLGSQGNSGLIYV